MECVCHRFCGAFSDMIAYSADGPPMMAKRSSSAASSKERTQWKVTGRD
jgi:hypothetical protein